MRRPRSVFGYVDDERVVDCAEGAADVELGVVESDVRPLQAERLSAPHAGRGEQEQRSPERVALERDEEAVQLLSGPRRAFT